MNKFSYRPNGTKCVQLMFHDDEGNPLDEILTKQSFKDECDINNIIQRYRKNGVLPPPPEHPGVYGDFSEVTTFQDAKIKIQEAEELFNGIPARIRARFENDPGKFLDFVDDPVNHQELVEMGLVDPRQPTSVETEVKQPEAAVKAEQ